jgi:uncharacterized protein YcbK (DUF882 family)
MNRRVSMAAGLVVSLVAGTARADLTVFYATDGPTGPLIASVGGRASEPSRPEPTPAAAHLPERPTPREVLFVRVGDGSGEEARITLLDANGQPDARGLDRLSVLARPRGTAAPTELSSDDPDLVAPGIRRLHPSLALRLAQLADRFPERGIEIVSGYRPDAREGSRHRHARALDLRVRGEATEAVRAFLEAQPETGVGFYPTSGFVHVDIRARSVHWVDRSGPGEPPAIVREGERAPSETAQPDEAPADPGTVDDARRAIEALDIDLGLELD